MFDANHRLVGCPPFWHRKQMVMLRNIMEGKFSFSSPEWADISEAPKDLIRRLLVVDPVKRITIDEALNHSFFQTVVGLIFFSFKFLPWAFFSVLFSLAASKCLKEYLIALKSSL